MSAKVTKKRILVVMALLSLAGVGAAGAAFLPMVTATRGPRIAKDAPATAVLVVDVQEDYTGANAKQPYRDGTRLVSVINRLTHAATERGWWVVFVPVVVPNQWFYRLLTGGTVVRGAPGSRLDQRLVRPPSSVEIVKSRADAFSNPELDHFLRAHQVGRLIITGLDATRCIKATAGGATNRGYRTIVVDDAIATDSGRPLSELVASYRALGASVRHSDELLAQTDSTPAPMGIRADSGDRR